HHERICSLLSYSCERFVEIAKLSHLHRFELNSKRLSRRLQFFENEGRGYSLRISKDSDKSHGRKSFLQHLQSFAREFRRVGQAGLNLSNSSRLRPHIYESNSSPIPRN